MNLNLTQEQAQAVIDAQERELKALRLRLTQAHVTMKYMVRMTGQLTPMLRTQAVAALQELLDSDQPEGPDDWGYQPRYNHSVLEELIEQYQALERDPKWSVIYGIELPMLSYLWQFAVNRHNDSRARNVVCDVERLMTKYLWRSGEPETPDHFSTPGLES